MRVWQWVVAATLGGMLSGCTSEAQPGTDVSNTRQASPLRFEAACESGEQLNIAAVGDLLIHGRLQKQALAHEEGFRSLWSQVVDHLQAADVTYANLEGPTAPGVRANGTDVPDPGAVFDGVVYSSYPQFNYHPSLLDDLIVSGVDVVSTANNHSLDRRALGADRTVEELERRDLAFTGTRKRGDDGPWAAIVDAKGFRLAWIACTYGTNGIPDPDHQVAACWDDKTELLTEITELRERDDVDAVIVTPHWGQEYATEANSAQKNLAHAFLDAGATLVIGAHPHVLQPWERYVTRDGRETFAIYSLGNFVSGQRHLRRRSTMILNVGLTRAASGEVFVNGARYVPLNMSENDGLTLELIDKNGGAQDSRETTVDMFGLFNLAPPTLPVTTNPECTDTWRPAISEDGWIGGSCESDDVCGGNTCDTSWQGGHCTQSCDRFCPEASGRASTFCIDDLETDGGVCALQCDSHEDCRNGYECMATGRHGDPSATAKVCVGR